MTEADWVAHSARTASTASTPDHKSDKSLPQHPAFTTSNSSCDERSGGTGKSMEISPPRPIPTSHADQPPNVAAVSVVIARAAEQKIVIQSSGGASEVSVITPGRSALAPSEVKIIPTPIREFSEVRWLLPFGTLARAFRTTYGDDQPTEPVVVKY